MKNTKTLAALTALALTVSLTSCSAGKTAATTPAPAETQPTFSDPYNFGPGIGLDYNYN